MTFNLNIYITQALPSAAELKSLFTQNDYPIRKFFITSSVKYRELGVKDLLPNLSGPDLLSSDAN